MMLDLENQLVNVLTKALILLPCAICLLHFVKIGIAIWGKQVQILPHMFIKSYRSLVFSIMTQGICQFYSMFFKFLIILTDTTLYRADSYSSCQVYNIFQKFKEKLHAMKGSLLTCRQLKRWQQVEVLELTFISSMLYADMKKVHWA